MRSDTDTLRLGFTLIEVLLALAIIGALAAILLPVLARGRAEARKSSCLANERQLGVAFRLYLSDYDERWPDYRCDPSAVTLGPAGRHALFCQGMKPSEMSFTALLRPYTRSHEITRCPADVDWRAGGRIETSYEYKLWLTDGKRLADVPSDSRLALLWEQWGYHVGDGHASEYDRSAAMNILFTDGHTNWHRLSDATTARYGSGPDLHGLFREDAPDDAQYGADF